MKHTWSTHEAYEYTRI